MTSYKISVTHHVICNSISRGSNLASITKHCYRDDETFNGQLRGTAAFCHAICIFAKMASPLFAARAAHKAAFNVAGKRYLSDISITRTGKPIMRVEGGR